MSQWTEHSPHQRITPSSVGGSHLKSFSGCSRQEIRAIPGVQDSQCDQGAPGRCASTPAAFEHREHSAFLPASTPRFHPSRAKSSSASSFESQIQRKRRESHRSGKFRQEEPVYTNPAWAPTPLQLTAQHRRQNTSSKTLLLLGRAWGRSPRAQENPEALSLLRGQEMARGQDAARPEGTWGKVPRLPSPVPSQVLPS